MLARVIDSLAFRVSGYNRDRKWDLFQSKIGIEPDYTILDVGYSDNEYSDSGNYLERHYPYQDKITALGIEQPDLFPKKYPEVKVIRYDGTIFPFKDQAFDVCWANAVIEHVGPFDKQVVFLKEIKRVAKQAFITTPNRRFPIEVHTRTPLLHQVLPKKFFDKYLNMVGKDWAAGDYMYLLSLKDIKRLMAEAEINSYEIIPSRLFGFILDFVIIF